MNLFPRTQPNLPLCRPNTTMLLHSGFRQRNVASSVVDPYPYLDGENGSGTDTGSIKSNQNKGNKNNLRIFIRFII